VLADGLSPQERADALQERLRERNVERLEQEETDHAKGMKGEAERRRALQDLVKIKREREQMEAMKAAEEIKRDRVDARRRNEEAKRKYADVGIGLVHEERTEHPRARAPCLQGGCHFVGSQRLSPPRASNRRLCQGQGQAAARAERRHAGRRGKRKRAGRRWIDTGGEEAAQVCKDDICL